MKTLLIIASFFVLSAGVVRNGIPALTAFAKSDATPGQANKAANAKDRDTTVHGNSDNSNRGSSQGQLKKQAAPTLLLTASESAKVRAFLSNRTTGKPLAKIGPAKLREYLMLEGTGSAVVKQVKFERLTVREATPGAQMKRHAVSGVITELGQGFVVISHQIQTERAWTIYYNTGTVVKIKDVENATGADLKVGMRIAAVGEPLDTGGLLAKRIHVIPGKAIGVYEKQPEASEGGNLDLTPTPVATATATPETTPEVSPSAEPEATPTSTEGAEPSPTEIPSVFPTP